MLINCFNSGGTKKKGIPAHTLTLRYLPGRGEASGTEGDSRASVWSSEPLYWSILRCVLPLAASSCLHRKCGIVAIQLK